MITAAVLASALSVLGIGFFLGAAWQRDQCARHTVAAARRTPEPRLRIIVNASRLYDWDAGT